jgi:hypothetical protein
MTPKEKAIQLYLKFRNEFPVLASNIRAKKCALIAQDRVIEVLEQAKLWANYGSATWADIDNDLQYEIQVKQEIGKL